MVKTWLGALTLVVLATPAVAAPPDVATLVAQMKQALEPPQASVRKIAFTVTSEGISTTLQLGQVRGKQAEANRIMTVVLGPADVRGMAYLIQEGTRSDADVQWVYVPAVGRIRKLVSPEAFSPFLNSDFAYTDLGFISLRATYSVKGEDTVNGTKVYRIDALPQETWYYSHIVTTMDAGTEMPIDRQYFDPAGALWKIQRWEGVTKINGVPTAVNVVMEDVQTKNRSVMKTTDLQYGATIPDTLLRPEGLPEAARAPLWTSFQAPVGP